MKLPRPDLEISQMLAMEAARHIAWLIDAVEADDHSVTLRGWGLITQGTHSEVRVLLNGVASQSLEWFESPDLSMHFFGIENSDRARFVARFDQDAIPRQVYYRFEFEQNANAELTRRTAWWLRCAPATGAMGERVSRVIGTEDALQFGIGGATLFHRIQDHLARRFGRRYEDMHAVLDWGCGAGRLLTHFAEVAGPEIWGADVDPDNLQYCRETFQFAHFEVFPLRPPTRLQDQKFDLIVGISVCTHLSERDQQVWLAELRRITRKGAIVMLSVQGDAQSALYRLTPDEIRAVHKRGFCVRGVNPRINDQLSEGSYYKDVIQTRENIRSNWGQHFEVLEFLDGMAANQDMVVMLAR